jgi:hypothetical protein
LCLCVSASGDLPTINEQVTARGNYTGPSNHRSLRPYAESLLGEIHRKSPRVNNPSVHFDLSGVSPAAVLRFDDMLLTINVNVPSLGGHFQPPYKFF